MSDSPDSRRVPPPLLPPPQLPGGYGPRPQGYAPRPDARQAPPTYPQPPHGHYGQPPGYYAPYGGGVAQPGYGGYGAPPPRRRSGGASRVLLGLVGLVSAVVFFLVLASAFVGGQESDSFVRDSSGRPADPTDPDAAPVDPDRFREVLQENTVYGQGGLRQRDCVAAPLEDADTDAQQRYYDRLMDCLDTAWEPMISSAGYRYDTPTLVVFDAPISTPCGSAAPEDGRTLAFYCPTDSVLYADAPQMRRFFEDVEMAYAVVIGHEFGHHVQSEVGILLAVDDAVYARFSDRVELSRRVELQASCLSGLFLGAVATTYPISESDYTDLQQVSLSFGDEPGAGAGERDHGSGRSNQAWILAAFDNNDIARCNTFTAPDDAVD